MSCPQVGTASYLGTRENILLFIRENILLFIRLLVKAICVSLGENKARMILFYPSQDA